MRNGRFQWRSKGDRFSFAVKYALREAKLTWVCGVGGLIATTALAQPPLLATTTGAARANAVASESPTATRDAAQILKRGGSAADAAVVTALVAGVASPTSSGIGGGGFAVVWDAKSNTPFVLDFREQAPRGAEREPFETRPLADPEKANLTGVPGEVRGLFELHQRAGKLRWADLVTVAAQRAKNGFPVGRHLGSMLGYAAGKLKGRAGFSALFYPGGKPAIVGSTLTNPALAKTLERIAAEGPSAFYEGVIAEDLVTTSRAHGGKLTRADLKDYKVRQRAALHVNYEGYDIYTMPPPSAGGLMMVQTLKMFSSDFLKQLGHGTPAYQHALAEALRGAIADRMKFVGDPDFQDNHLEELLADERLEKRRAKIALDRTHSIPRFALDEKGTHALITSDLSGNVVSLTTTVNSLFGAMIMAENSGIVLNNELDDFGSRDQVAPFGLTETPNRARPGARPVSSMTPTIVVRDGEPVLALGGSGGTAIATNATQALLAALVFDHEPRQAVSAPRFYVPTSGAHMLVEKGTPPQHTADLQARGEIVEEARYNGTAIQMLRFDGGTARGAADPRKYGLALVNGLER